MLPNVTSQLVAAFELSCHPQSACASVRAISGQARLVDGALALTFALAADMARLRMPAPAPPRAADELWRHTCFEAFIAGQGSAAYHEFNFSPSGEWAAYAFGGYRERSVPPPAFDPRIAVRRTPHALELEAVIAAAVLPQPGVLRLGMCAVIEDQQGELTYWALRHAAGKPDFHHTDSFALAIERRANGFKVA
jgi:hypothetical protein